jgi:hypothetical protein
VRAAIWEGMVWVLECLFALAGFSVLAVLCVAVIALAVALFAGIFDIGGRP